jgi:hypothetical protein
VRAAVVLTLMILLLAPMDVPEQCDALVFARANPGLCYSGPYGHFPGGGGGGSGGGGILGTIGRVLGGLTGGLL